MKIQNIGQRGILFSFDDIGRSTFGNQTTHVYAVNCGMRFFVIDTYMGPGFMREVQDFLVSTYGKKPFVVVNSHYHWDHVLGNSAFKDCDIIAHDRCREIMAAEYRDFPSPSFCRYLEEYRFVLPDPQVEIVLPTLTFSDRLCFPDERLTLFFTPGHSADSISVYDERDRVLFAGDNVELPHPTYLDPDCRESHVTSLRRYQELPADIIIPGHDALLDREGLKANLRYLEENGPG